MFFSRSPRPLARAAVVLAVLALAFAATAGSAAAGPRDTILPTSPGNPRTTAVGHDSVDIAWNASTDNVGIVQYGIAAVQYAAWAPRVLGVVRVPGNQNTATIPNLRPNNTYELRLQAYDGTNWSWQSTLDVTTNRELDAPTAPTGLAVSHSQLGTPVDGVTASKALLTWTVSTDDYGPVRYDVLVNGVPSADVWWFGRFGSTSLAWVRQLEPGTTYRLAVRARDGSGNVSAPSNAVTVTTDARADTAPPTTPTLQSAGAGGVSYCPEELWMRWTAASDAVDPASAIEYEVRVDGRIIEVFTGLTRVVTYTSELGVNVVTVVAVDTAGNASAPSNAINETALWGVGSDCPE